MKHRRFLSSVLILLAFSGTVLMVFAVIQPALADVQDASIFYEELQKFGTWYEDPDYGPAWYPTQDPNADPPRPSMPAGGLMWMAAGLPPNRVLSSKPPNPGVGPPTITATVP